MVRTTKAQRAALFQIFQRDFPGWITPTKRIRHPEMYKRDAFPYTLKEGESFAERHPEVIVKVPSKQYRRFRKTVQPYFGGECVMVPYAGMWLGIEQDGYTHS